jgi:GNAT superfamily N-acetyltransferase
VNSPAIRSADSTDPPDAQELRDSLHEFKSATTGFHDGRGPSCFIRDADGHREGVGRQLVEAAIDEARARGCGTVIVATQSFQAPGFHETLRFVEVGRTTGTPLGHDEIVYQMRLDGCPE